MSRSWFVVFVVVLLPLPAHGIVDVHDYYYANPDTDAFSVLGFDFEGATGTKEEIDLEITNHTVVRREADTWMFVGSLNLAETNNSKSADSNFFHLRYTRRLDGAHGMEVIAQTSQDQFELLDKRVVYGLGYRYEWKPGVGDERGLLGAGVIREHERYVDILAEERLWRANLYMTVEQPVSFARDASISLSVYAQPALDDPGDVRAIAVTGFNARLSPKLAVKFSVDFKYDSDPEETLESTNFSYSTGITYTLR